MAEGGMKRGNGAIRMSVAFALLYTSLALVVWRQSRALEELRGLESARSERVVLQAERWDLQREIQRLESRSRITSVASARLQLRTPAAHEITFLHEPVYAGAVDAGTVPPRRDLLTTAERRP
jgi:cell division protein FtsL